MRSDIEIARKVSLKPIGEIAEFLGLRPSELFTFGPYIAKIPLKVFRRLPAEPKARLVLVTAMSPTPMGEGKTTLTIGLAMALWKLGKRAVPVLREPSLGPVFGIKGGATGGGYAQVLPMEAINLHFTGDSHAVDSAHDLLSAMLDNHIHQGNELDIDLRWIFWRRAIDMNDRALRYILVGLGGPRNGYPREDGFDITPSSEVMAILGLSGDYRDLRERLGRILVGLTRRKEPVTAADLKAAGAMAALLRDALMPNLVQTIEHTPAFIHTGPFGNIAHGTASRVSIELALRLAEIAIVEAGFGSDLGGEKFMDIMAPQLSKKPDAAVVVATLRALKYHGGVPKDRALEPNREALERGLPNLEKHVENMRTFGVPVLVVLNRFLHDTPEEIQRVRGYVEERMGVPFAVAEVWARGGEGGIEAAQTLQMLMERESSRYRPLYDPSEPVEEKVEKIARLIYGAGDVEWLPEARRKLRLFRKLGYEGLYVCISKTQYSLSDDPKRLGRPEGFTLTIRDLRIRAGAGFLVPMAGDILEMPGLPKVPAAERVDIDEEGNIYGIF